MDENVFSAKIFELIKKIHARMLLCVIKACEPYDLTPPQASILLSLSKKKSIKVSELGSQLRTADSNISAICSRLEERGFITRERDTLDRRVVYIKPTAKAVGLCCQLESEKLESLRLANVSDADQDEIIRALEKLIILLE